MAGKKKKKKHRFFWFIAKLHLVLLFLVTAAAAWLFFGGYAKEIRELRSEALRMVSASRPDTFRGNQTSIVYAADNSVISTLKGGKESYYLAIEDIPPNAVAAIISIEDKRFYRHNGVDYKALLRAFKVMIENGKATQGGSTITMQLVRNIFISQEKTWQRKVQEIFLAWEMEEKYSKDQILEFYLNNIYFGNGYYGIQSASRGYFNRDAAKLSLSQLAFLCAIPNNPTLYDPLTNMGNTISRRNRILKRMLEDGKISDLAYSGALEEVISLERPASIQKNDYVETYAYYCAIRALMETEDFHFQYYFDSGKEKDIYDAAYEVLYTECQRKLYTAGYHIYTSFDLKLQEELQDAVDGTLSGFTEVNEEGVYTLQASAVCIDNESGYVKAAVGGRKQDFSGYTLNRAYQSFRQPGSAIKPLSVYTPAFEHSYTPESIVVDEPIEDGPKNSGGGYAGEMTVRTAVERSVNTIAWKLYEELTPERGLSYLKEMNFSKLDREDYRPATALGGFTNGVSALEMAAGYAAIENDGEYRTPTCIVRIVDGSGNEIYASEQTEKVIYRQNAARMMTDVMKGVMTQGTGRGLGLGEMPCAGKTGTTNDNKDGWFAGYTRYYTTSVWVGYDMPRKMDGLMGRTYPGKIWQTFMLRAHEGLEPLDFLSYAKLSDEFVNTGAPEKIIIPGAEEEPEEEMPGEAQAPEGGNEAQGEAQKPENGENTGENGPESGNPPGGNPGGDESGTGGSAGGNEPGNGSPPGGDESGTGGSAGESEPGNGSPPGGDESGTGGNPGGGNESGDENPPEGNGSGEEHVPGGDESGTGGSAGGNGL